MCLKCEASLVGEACGGFVIKKELLVLGRPWFKAAPALRGTCLLGRKTGWCKTVTESGGSQQKMITLSACWSSRRERLGLFTAFS